MNFLRRGFCLMAFFAGIFFPSVVFAQEYEEDDSSSLSASEAATLPAEDLNAVAPITFNELRFFVRDWKKYTRWLKKNDNEYKAVAYLDVSPSSDYPPEVVKWMDEHGWAVDRFFLLERKFRQTIAIQKRDAKQNALKAHLERQIKDLNKNPALSIDQKKAMRKQYQETIATVRASMKGKAPVTQEEYELIKLNHDVLAKILDE